MADHQPHTLSSPAKACDDQQDERFGGICWLGRRVGHYARHDRGSIEPHQDLGLANLDLLDQGSHAFAKLERCKLGPALRQLCQSVEHGSLGRGVKAERRDGVTDFRTRREEGAQTVEHPFDVARRNAPAYGMLVATASDKRRRDIVSIPLALLDVGDRRAPSLWKIRPGNRLGASAPTAIDRSRRPAASLS